MRREGGDQRILRAVGLSVERPDRPGVPPLEVPLIVQGPHDETAITIFTGGVLWEDERASITCTIEVTERPKAMYVRINGHHDIRLKLASPVTLTRQGTHAYRCEGSLDATSRPSGSDKLFDQTCGLARVQLCVLFSDGHEEFFTTPDIVCLDEPIASSGEGSGLRDETAEEENVRAMIETLMALENNQAAEWMFSPSKRTPSGDHLSQDDDTDWRFSKLNRLVETSFAAMDLVYDATEDEQDSFPNESHDAESASVHDTPENRAVRALLVSIRDELAEAVSQLEKREQELDEQVATLTGIMTSERDRRGIEQSLPAITFFKTQEQQVGTALDQLRDAYASACEAVEGFDQLAGGADRVRHERFYVPPRKGLFATDEVYVQLHDAMRLWRTVSDDELLHSRPLARSLRPDQLFEFYTLHLLLTGLYRLGYRENDRYANPIDTYEYTGSGAFSHFFSPDLCANAYHLCKRADDGSVDEVDLLFQPYIYADRREEAGVAIHRVLDDGELPDQNDFWTPDYLLVTRRAKQAERVYALDAKYVDWSKIVGSGGKLSECVGKYYLQTSRTCEGRPQTGVSGVWILCGKADAHGTSVVDPKEVGVDVESLPNDAIPTFGVAAWNRKTGRRIQLSLLSQLGIE